jgi:hypothetical protein
MDECLNWSVFAFSVTKDAEKQRFNEVLSSKELGLFDYVQEITNKVYIRVDSATQNSQLFQQSCQLGF